MENKLEKLFKEYIEECQYSGGLRPETIRSYKEVFKHFVKTMPEINIPELISPLVVTEFFKRLHTRIRVVGNKKIRTGIKNSTIKTYGSKLRAFCEWLVKRGHIKENPISRMSLPEPVYEDIRALNREQVEKIIASIVLHSPNPLMFRRDNLIVHILLFCGLRKGELLGLQLRDIDIKNRMLTIRAETSKSKRTHQVPLNPIVMMHLQEYLIERNKHGYKTPYLFVSSLNDSELTTHGLKHWVERIKRISGVKFHVHRFRHTFATNLGNKNTSIIKIQKLMGHKDPKMTMVYLRSMGAEDLREDINKLSIDTLE
jgi:integrase